VVDGTIELKRAVIGKFKRENNLIYNEKQVSVGVGGKHVIFNAILATINSGDEVFDTSSLLGVLSRHCIAGRRHSCSS